ncbi:peroxidase 65 [Musa troglodytarum]|uniref:peroxidase n=1 Tax=Musa troglodytarum TaxID=320322 RepID=A0A9E7KV05_9LILI|nr:peroxidase 65 [Musa troglodytarum]
MYYQKRCPKAEQIVSDVVTSKQIATPTTAAGALRLFFHDCFVGGCDASLLISTNAFNRAERDSDDNISLPGDAFDAVVRAKTALELQCPGVVSCADVLALATRDLVSMLGGPFFDVRLGRKDALASTAASVVGNLPSPNMTIDQLISIFAKRKFTVQEMVALSGAHTLLRGLGLLASDTVLAADPRTKPIVELYAANQTAFFMDFSHVMEKLSVFGVKTGRKGEIRRRCDEFNNLST